MNEQASNDTTPAPEQACAVCGSFTVYRCADCAISGRRTHVCGLPSCREQHETECTEKLRADGYEVKEEGGVRIIRRTEPLERLQWGLQPDVPCVAAWGARAIMEGNGHGGYRLDILHDRQAVAGPKAELHKLCTWCNDTGLPLLRKRINELGIQSDERRLVVVERPGLRLIANPNASYGYLYICAMLLPTGGKEG